MYMEEINTRQRQTICSIQDEQIWERLGNELCVPDPCSTLYRRSSQLVHNMETLFHWLLIAWKLTPLLSVDVISECQKLIAKKMNSCKHTTIMHMYKYYMSLVSPKVVYRVLMQVLFNYFLCWQNSRMSIKSKTSISITTHSSSINSPSRHIRWSRACRRGTMNLAISMPCLHTLHSSSLRRKSFEGFKNLS